MIWEEIEIYSQEKVYTIERQLVDKKRISENNKDIVQR